MISVRERMAVIWLIEILMISVLPSYCHYSARGMSLQRIPRKHFLRKKHLSVMSFSGYRMLYVAKCLNSHLSMELLMTTVNTFEINIDTYF